MRRIFFVMFVFFACKTQSLKNSAPLPTPEAPERSQDESGFALTDEGEYKKEMSNYLVTLSSQGTGGSWSNLGMMFLGYDCRRKLSMIFTEETTTDSGEARTIASQSDFDYSFFSSLNKIKTSIAINSLNKNPKLVIKERLWCDRRSKNGNYDHIWLEWKSVQSEKTIFSDAFQEKTISFQPEEKDMSFGMIFSSMRSVLIGFLTSYKFTLTTKLLGKPKFFDYTNCKPNSKTKPFYFHITQGFGSGKQGVNPHTFGLIVDGIALPSTPEAGSNQSSAEIHSASGYYGLAIKYCPLVDKPYIDLRAYAKGTNWLTSDELYLSKYKSLRLVRGENVQMSFDHKEFMGAVNTSPLNITVYNQDLTLAPGQDISDQASSKAEADLRRESYIKDDLMYQITSLQNEFSTCGPAYPRGEDLSPFVKSSIKGSFFESWLSQEELAKALGRGQAKGLGLASWGAVIGAHPIAFGLLAAGVAVTGVTVGLVQLAKYKQSGRQAVIDKFNTYSAYKACVSPEATKAHFQNTVSMLQDEIRASQN